MLIFGRVLDSTTMMYGASVFVIYPLKLDGVMAPLPTAFKKEVPATGLIDQ